MNQLTDSQREALAAVLEAAKRDWDDYRAHIQDGLDYPGRVVPLVEDFAEVSARWKAHFAEVEAMLAAEPAHQAELREFLLARYGGWYVPGAKKEEEEGGVK